MAGVSLSGSAACWTSVASLSGSAVCWMSAVLTAGGRVTAAGAGDAGRCALASALAPSPFICSAIELVETSSEVDLLRLNKCQSEVAKMTSDEVQRRRDKRRTIYLVNPRCEQGLELLCLLRTNKLFEVFSIRGHPGALAAENGE